MRGAHNSRKGAFKRLITAAKSADACMRLPLANIVIQNLNMIFFKDLNMTLTKSCLHLSHPSAASGRQDFSRYLYGMPAPTQATDSSH